MNKDKTSKLQELTLLFDTAWATYKAYFFKLLKINIVPVVLIAVLISVFLFIASFQSLIEYIDGGTIIQILTLVLGSAVLVSVISSLNYIAQIKLLAVESTDSSDVGVTTVSSYHHAAKILFPYMWVIILTILCVLAGTILLVVPGIVIAVWLSFSTIILIVEKAKGKEALKLSKKYVRGIWTPVLLRLLTAGFLGLLVSAAFTILVGFIHRIAGESVAVENVLNFVYQLVIAPYFVVYGYELYKDVVRVNKLVSEDVDVVGSMGTDTTATGGGEVAVG